jgi:uncharacterized membrane protein
MISLFVLVISFIVLRGFGALGVKRLSSWREAGRIALVIMFLFTGFSHFSSLKHDFAAMIPEPLPNDLWVIYLTGLFEIAGAVGLLIPRTERLAGICLVLLLVALFPANVNAIINEIPLGGNAPTPLWVRAPMQLLYIGMIWWTSIKGGSKEAGQSRVENRSAGTSKLPARVQPRERHRVHGRAGHAGSPVRLIQISPHAIPAKGERPWKRRTNRWRRAPHTLCGARAARCGSSASW